MLVGIGVVPLPRGADRLRPVEAVHRLFVDYFLKSHHQLINIEKSRSSSTSLPDYQQGKILIKRALRRHN